MEGAADQIKQRAAQRIEIDLCAESEDREKWCVSVKGRRGRRERRQ
jgi:hypothetical protein